MVVNTFSAIMPGPPPFHYRPADYIVAACRSTDVFDGFPLRESFPIAMAGKDEPKGPSTGVLTETKTRTQRPPLYKVMLLNDDYTPMEFVVHVLERFFGMSHAQAFELMLTVHKKGLAVVGVFSYEVAETKVGQVMDFARRHQHPLQCTMEKE
jgi:ATP-dependent Clp protease adaptor protein ClpS